MNKQIADINLEKRPRILIVEDEPKIREILAEFLADYGYSVDTAADGLEGLAMCGAGKYDLVLMDVMMPRVDGFAALELLRKDSDVPVIFITAMEDERQQMKGFDLTADDYIIKPFSMNMVIRRIEAVLRRRGNGADARARHAQIPETLTTQKGVSPADEHTLTHKGVSPDDDYTLMHKGVSLDARACEVRVNERPVPFTYKEFELLKILLENKNATLMRDELLSAVWGYDFDGDDKVVNNHIMRIRKKLGDDFITTVRGMGYKISD